MLKRMPLLQYLQCLFLQSDDPQYTQLRFGYPLSTHSYKTLPGPGFMLECIGELCPTFSAVQCKPGATWGRDMEPSRLGSSRVFRKLHYTAAQCVLRLF